MRLHTRYPRLSFFLLVLAGIALVTGQPSVLAVGAGDTVYLPLVSRKEPPLWLGPDGGSVVALVRDPRQPDTFYAGTSGGGVFKSTDGGLTWSFAGNGLGYVNIDSLAVDPQDSSILYAGTHGSGVYKTEDGGANWFPVNQGIHANAVVYTLAVNPGNHHLVYAGTRGAPGTNGPPWHGVLYKSTNGGASWSAVLQNVGGKSAQDWVYSLAVDPGDPDTILAATHEHGPYRANDYGGSGDWKPAGEVSDGAGRAVAFDPRAWTGIAYYATWHRDGIFKSTDDGESWTQSNTGMGNAKIYPNGIAIKQTNPQVVYLASFGDDVHGVLRSDDAGESWRRAGLDNRYIYSVAASGRKEDIVLAGTYSDGLYRSSNGGASWSQSMSGLRNAQVTGIAVAPDSAGTAPPVMLGSTFGSGIFRSVDGGVTWTSFNANLGDRWIYGLVQHPDNPNLVFALTDKAGLRRCDFTAGCGWVSTLDFELDLTAEVPVQDPPDRYLRDEPLDDLPDAPASRMDRAAIEPRTDLAAASIASPVLSMAFAPSNANIAYLGTNGRGVYKSTDGGIHWAQTGLKSGPARSLAVSPVDPNTVYVATYDPASRTDIVRVSRDGGQTWQPLLPVTSAIHSLAILPGNPGVLYAGTSDGVQQYNGFTWTPAGLQGQPVTVLRESRHAPGMLFAGTRTGAYLAGESLIWYSAAYEIEGVSVQSISISPADPLYAYIGTTSRGTLRISLP